VDGSSVLDILTRQRIIPVITIDDAAHASELFAALSAGGINCAEITLRTEAGLPSIATKPFRDFIVGAGTVLTLDQVDRCADAGASFVVSPGFDEDVADRARERGMAVVPGIATATELMAAYRSGITSVKFFPADRLGGLETIRSLSGPFPNARFMPSGGVGLHNAGHYLEFEPVFAVSGSWMAPRHTIAAGDFTMIEKLSADAVALIRSDSA